MSDIRLAMKCVQDSTVDGPGLRIVVWTQGCTHNCKGCHNPDTHDLDGGYIESADNIIKFIKQAKMQRGVTFSGGEPFLQPLALIPIAIATKEQGLDVWAYSGYTFEQILKDKDKKTLVENIDVLVDGPFVLAKKDHRLVFKGSSNQRIIDVKESLKQNRIVLSKYDDANAGIK